MIYANRTATKSIRMCCGKSFPFIVKPSPQVQPARDFLQLVINHPNNSTPTPLLQSNQQVDEVTEEQPNSI